MPDRFDQIDAAITRWMARHGIFYLRISLGVVFLWFGIHKWIDGFSPVEELAGTTILTLTTDAIDPNWSVPFLGMWEAVIGIGLITGRAVRVTLFFLFMQLLGALTPLFLFPERMFKHVPFVLTLEGQYIVKNLVLVSAGIVIGATARGASLGPLSAESDQRP